MQVICCLKVNKVDTSLRCRCGIAFLGAFLDRLRMDRLRMDRLRMDRLRMDRLRMDRLRMDRLRMDRLRMDRRLDARHVGSATCEPSSIR
jgi:hypothetical protein